MGQAPENKFRLDAFDKATYPSQPFMHSATIQQRVTTTETMMTSISTSPQAQPFFPFSEWLKLSPSFPTIASDFQSNLALQMKATSQSPRIPSRALTGLGIQLDKSPGFGSQSYDNLTSKESNVDYGNRNLETSHSLCFLPESSPISLSLADPFTDSTMSTLAWGGLTQDYWLNETSVLSPIPTTLLLSKTSLFLSPVPVFEETADPNLDNGAENRKDATFSYNHLSLLPATQSPPALSRLYVDINMFTECTNTKTTFVRLKDLSGFENDADEPSPAMMFGCPSNDLHCDDSDLAPKISDHQPLPGDNDTEKNPSQREVTLSDSDSGLSPCCDIFMRAAVPDLPVTPTATISCQNNVKTDETQLQGAISPTIELTPSQWSQILDYFFQTVQGSVSTESTSSALVFDLNKSQVEDDQTRNHFTSKSSPLLFPEGTYAEQQPVSRHKRKFATTATLKDVKPPRTRAAYQLQLVDSSFALDVAITNSHEGVSEHVAAHKVAYHRKQHPGEKLSEQFLFTFAGKLLQNGQTTSAYRCYISNCEKTTKRKDHMADHIRMHLGEKPFKCHKCGLGFIRANDCQRHEYNHNPQRRFLCECNAAFTRKDLYVRHKNLACPLSIHNVDNRERSFKRVRREEGYD